MESEASGQPTPEKTIRPGILQMMIGLWVLLIFGYFYQRFALPHLTEVVLNGLALIFFLGFFIALGRKILGMLRFDFFSFAEEIGYSFGIGTGLMMAVIFLLATLKILYAPLVIGMVIILVLIVYPTARDLAHRGWKALQHNQTERLTGFEISLLTLIGVSASATFLAAATPVFFYDALVYHLAVPNKFLLNHGFHSIPYQNFSNFPANMGLLFIVIFSFSKGMLVQLLTWAYAPMTALHIYGFTRPRWGREIALLATAISLIIPGVLIISTLTSVEGPVMLYSFLSLTALLHWMKSPQKNWFVLAAFFCGIVMGIKYTTMVTTFSGLLFILFVFGLKRDQGGLKKGLQYPFLFGLIALGCVAPWFIKNLVYTGNPLYPFFSSLFSADVPEHTNYAQFMKKVGNPVQLFLRQVFSDQTPSLPEWGNFIGLLISSPWKFTFQVSGAAGKPGIVFLLCLPAVLFIRRFDQTTRYLLLFSVVSFVLWIFLLPWIQRFVFPILPVWSVISAYILWKLVQCPLPKFLIHLTTLLILGFHLLMFFDETGLILKSYNYLFANQSNTTFLLNHGVNYYPAMQFINRETPSDAKILIVGESRGYYCERDYLLYTAIEGIDVNQLPLRQFIVMSKNMEEVIEKLKQEGITHILVNIQEMKRLTGLYRDGETYHGFAADSREQEILNTLFTPGFMEQLYHEHETWLYRIK